MNDPIPPAGHQSQAAAPEHPARAPQVTFNHSAAQGPKRGFGKFSRRTKWVISNVLTFLLGIVLVYLWLQLDDYHPQTGQQLVNNQAVNDYVDTKWNKLLPDGTAPTIKIPTGIFIQSLRFVNSSDVHLTGYIWHRYTQGINDQYKPAGDEVGFVFPEQVETDSEPRRAYQHVDEEQKTETIGWYFEATLRQKFSYTTYPFDHKTVWIRMWPKHFNENIVLVPDFEAYKSTGLTDTFGIDESIVLDAWEREDTYFSYRSYNYDTNFGIPYIGQRGFPELHYNFVIKRRVSNALVVHLMPIFLVSALLFGSLLTVSDNSEMATKHGFDTTSVIAACSALFFVVMIAHVQLRREFAGSGMVYMETFYFVVYVMLVLAAAFTYLFASEGTQDVAFFHEDDALTVKLLYWPLFLGIMAALTAGLLTMT